MMTPVTQTVYEWTCDESGVVATTAGGEPPTGWARVAVNGVTLDLCATCAAPILAVFAASQKAIAARGK